LKEQDMARPTIAVVTKNRTNPAYGGALAGATRAAARYGAAIAYFAPETPDDIAEQAAILETAIGGGYDAIALMPAHETALDPTLDRIAAAGIPLVFVVNRPKHARGVTFIGADNRKLAAAIAARLFAHLGGSGDVAIVDGHPDSTTTPERHDGFFAATAEFPGIRILEARSGLYQRAPARDVMRALLDRYPRIDGVVVANDLMALGAIDALREAGRRMPLVSINGTPDAVAAIKAGDMLASACFDTLAFGSIAVEAALRHRRGDAVPAEILLPAAIIDAKNAAAWDKPYEQRDCASWDAVVSGGK
jgi:ribose transport system substrate-binding protein